MIGSKICAEVKEPNENGDIHIATEIDNNMSTLEGLAAIGSIATDLVASSNGELDIEDNVRAIRVVYYRGF